MNEDQFSAMLAIIVPPIIEQITKNSNVDDETASRFVDFMSGAVYLGKGEVELLNGQVLLCAPSAVHIEMDSLPRLTGIPLWRGPGV